MLMELRDAALLRSSVSLDKLETALEDCSVTMDNISPALTENYDQSVLNVSFQ